MSDLDYCEPKREHQTAGDEYCADAAALAARFDQAGIDWLDHFLADYVFAGEPLDRVLVKARELSALPRRREQATFDD